ncbi:cytochrome P450 [Pisolithus orientalis]|uniref:cytochrome P450 n=1 Tax=Pisolithus orientalis TaxID=936130 RepID=UPI0022240662|nr:cytochrome P450 [Pisolithus orientalis]KAI6003493.1 cytochrome P450 [Pisolithus orientalis]
MTSYMLTTAQISAVIIGLGFVLITHVVSQKESTHPPKVPSLLPWIGSAIRYVFAPTRFLALCCTQFGPVFKVLVGGRNIIVVGTAESIRSALFTDHRVLTAYVEHYNHFHVVCSDTSLYPLIHDTITYKLFPVFDRRLSKRAVDDLTGHCAETIFSRLKAFSEHEQVSLRRSLNEPLYVAVTAIFLGSKFSPDTYDDWVTFLDSVPKRLCRLPFWSVPSSRARGRLLQHVITCLQSANPDNDDDKLAGDFSKVLRENNISPEVASFVVLTVMLFLHTNMLDVVFWLFSWLMADPLAFSSLRDEIDRAVREEFGNIQTFIAEASPQRLDSPAFALLNSAILETTRLTTLQTGLRLAECDLELKDEEGTIPVRKGEYVLLFPRPAQRNEASYPDGHRFVIDRFVQDQYQGELTAAAGKPYFAFGAGRHLCKGRYLAMFGMKVLTILYLSLFDVTPAPLERRSSKWEPPQSSAHSIGTIRPTKDVFVKLRPRATL